VKISLIEPFLDHPTLFSLKRFPSEALIFYSGIFWSAPDINVGGMFSKLTRRPGLSSLVLVRSEEFGGLENSFFWFFSVRSYFSDTK
jgi:hypothetical protein